MSYPSWEEWQVLGMILLGLSPLLLMFLWREGKNPWAWVILLWFTLPFGAIIPLTWLSITYPWLQQPIPQLFLIMGFWMCFLSGLMLIAFAAEALDNRGSSNSEGSQALNLEDGGSSPSPRIEPPQMCE